MADFQPARRRGKDSAPQPTIKFPSQHQQLVDMGFDSNEVQRILEQTRGDLEKATAILLGDESGQPVVVEESFQEKKSGRKANTAGAASLPSNNSKEVTEAHKKMMATYKVFKCKETNNPNHDRKMCQYWHHSISDRRRNPFEFTYSCYECPNVVGGAECKDGDKCPHSHNMLERMFHPELFKISMCQRSQDGRKCDRGVVCAFAHSDAELRVSPSKLDPSLADKPPAKPATADIVIPDEVKERVLQLIKDAGSEGVHSSELLKKYQQKYEQALEISDSNYATNLKLKEMLKSHSNISLVYSRGNQPVYVFVDPTTAKKESEGESTTPTEGGKSEQEAQTSTSNSKGPLSLDVIRERLTEVIKNSGPDGIYGSDLPKKYLETFGERLELTDENGAKLKIKEILLSEPKIVAKNHKFQPKYCYDASAATEAPAVSKPAGKISYSAIASAAAEKEKAKTAAVTLPPSSNKPVKQKETKEKETKEIKEKEVAPAPVVAPEPVAPAVPAKKSFAAVLAAKAQAAPLAPASAAPSVVESTETSSTTPETESSATKETPAETSDSPVPVEEPAVENPAPVEVPVPIVEPLVPVQPEPVAPQPIAVAVPPTIVPPAAPEASSMSKLVPSVSIADSPVSLPPSVFPVSESSLSAHGHDLLLFGIDKKAGDSIELPPQTMQQSKFHDLIYNLKPSSAPFGNTPLSPDRSRSEHSLMPPGLTKPQKNDVPTNLLSQSLVHDETARKLAQSQSQISALQDQINSLKKELAASKVEYDNQASQLKSTQLKLKELETKASMDTEPLKAQLKAKEEEFNSFYVQVQDELKRSLQERYTEINQNLTWFQQIEFAIHNSKCEEINRDTISREDLLQFVHLLPTIRQFCASCKQQLKYKHDMMQRPTASFLDPYASANRGYPMAQPYQNMYDQSYFQGQFAYGNAYSHGAAVPPAHQCALTGCPQPGVLPCSMCYGVYYCSSEHQHAHYPQHLATCGHHNI